MTPKFSAILCDPPWQFTLGSLFTGIGGIDLAFAWAGFTSVFQVEIKSDRRTVLADHWPNVPRFKDAKTFGRSDYAGAVDVIAGGPPCQPYSHAGKRRGKADDRHLWPEMLRIIREFAPRAVFFENVAGIVRMVLPDIVSDLEGAGYTVVPPTLVPACAVGAAHRRDRVFLMAYAKSYRVAQQPGLADAEALGLACALSGYRTGERCPAEGIQIERRTAAMRDQDVADAHSALEERHEQAVCAGRDALNPGSQTLADPERQELALRQNVSADQGEEQPTAPGSRNAAALSDADQHSPQRAAIARQERIPGPAQPGLVRDVHGLPDWLDGGHRWPAFIGQPQYEWEPPRTVKGFSGRAKRVEALGDAVVPQVIYPFAQAIYQALEREDLNG